MFKTQALHLFLKCINSRPASRGGPVCVTGFYYLDPLVLGVHLFFCMTSLYLALIPAKNGPERKEGKKCLCFFRNDPEGG